MGYSTYFKGNFETDSPMSDELVKEINDFNDTRHCKNETDGYNDSAGYPGFWCQWKALNSYEIGWDGGEKFYEYTAWLVYIIDEFIKPNGLVLNGETEWTDDYNDMGKIVVKDNVVYEVDGYIAYTDLMKVG